MLAGELGDELAILPDGTTKLVGAGLYDVPAGTQIVNAEDTADILKYADNVRSIEKLADGNTELTMNAQEPDTESIYTEFLDVYRPILNEELRGVCELVAVSIKNATETLVSEDSDRHDKLVAVITSSADDLKTFLDSQRVSHEEMLSTAFNNLNSNLTSGLQQVASAVGATIDSLKSTISSLEHSITSSSKATNELLDTSVDYSAKAYEAAEKGDYDGMMKALSDRGLKIGIIGTDYGHTQDTVTATAMSKYKNATIKANAYGGVVSDDQLVRVGEFGKQEAILPLEQPSVMAKVGAAVGRYTGTTLTAELLSGLLTEVTEMQTEELAVAIDNSAKIIGEELNGLNHDASSALDKLGTNMDAVQKAIVDNGSTIDTTVRSTGSSILSEISSAASSICSAVKSISINIESNIGGSGSSSATHKGTVMSPNGAISTGITLGQKVFGAALGAVGKKTKGSAGKKTKGSASGSLVTKDALYRAGELGLNEAIIPLEKPDIMRYVGSTIASYMPVETQALQGAIGMKNAGITAPGPAASPMHEDMSSLVSDVTQHVLESVLPAMSNMGSSDEAKTPVYVGTLIADERGLKQLERKLYVIRKAEEARRQ